MRQPRRSWEIGWARPGDCRRSGAIVLRSWRREPLLLSQGTHCRALLDQRREVRRRSEGLNGVVVTLRGEVSEPVSGGTGLGTYRARVPSSVEAGRPASGRCPTRELQLSTDLLRVLHQPTGSLPHAEAPPPRRIGDHQYLPKSPNYSAGV